MLQRILNILSDVFGLFDELSSFVIVMRFCS